MGFFEKKVLLNILDGVKPVAGSSVTLSKGTNAGFLRFRVTFKLDAEYRVTDINWQKKGKRSLEKAVAGAYIGNKLSGHIGFLTGAAIGGKKKDVSTAVITFIDNDVEKSICVQCNKKQYEDLKDLL